jgi:signal transduction histidine kinase
MSIADSSLTLREGSSHRQTRILLFGGFGGLLLLMGVLGLSAISFLYQIEIRGERIRSDYVSRDRALDNLRSNIYISGTTLRDFLLDESQTAAASHRKQFLRKRAEIESQIADYQALAGLDQAEPLQQLKDELASFFDAAVPALEWGPKERRTLGYRFMQDQVLPRRLVALGLTDRIQQLSDKQLNASSEAVTVMLSSFRTKLLLLLVFTVMIGLGLAGAALWRLLRLEHESLERFREVLHTREELKQLSGELVSAQENERRRISRELHDEVGQVLSAIVLGIENLRSALRDNNKEEAFRQLQLVQDMTERNVSVVRNISLLLRPTMLDDLGLVPAVRWLAREVSRSGAMAVDVLVESFLDELPEEHRTCIFRVVQEAVRNASRHSGARHVRIYLQEEQERLRVSVQDDGKGFAATQEPGLGILGMQERVIRLGGELQVDSEPGRGTIVSFTLPLPEKIDNSDHSPGVLPHQIDSFRTA